MLFSNIDKECSTFICDNPSELYPALVKAIHMFGEATSPRGLKTLELRRVNAVIKSPRERLVLVPGRGINPFFLVAESMWILHGSSNSEQILPYNRGLARFLDEGDIHFHGAYGERIRGHYWYGRDQKCYHKVKTIDQLAFVVDKLQEDPDSRQAVIVLWDPFLDSKVSKDIPCNDMLFFKVRDGRLNMTVLNRSNDVHLGFPVTNTFQFTMIQEVVALMLGVDMGTYCQFSDSLHMYMDAYKGEEYTKKVLGSQPSGFKVPSVPMRPIGSAKSFIALNTIFANLVLSIRRDLDESVIRSLYDTGVFLDFAYYLSSYLNYKDKSYGKAWRLLQKVNDFSLFLAGFEFYFRAIKDKTLNPVLTARAWQELYDRTVEAFEIPMINSVTFFVKGGHE